MKDNEFLGRYVFTFGTAENFVKSQTFIDGTEGFVDVLRLIGNRIDALTEIEYYIEAIEPGSVRVNIRGFYKKLNNFVSNNILGIIIVSVFANWLSDKLKRDDAPIVQVGSELTQIEINGKIIVIPKDALKYYQSLKNSEDIDRAVKKTFRPIQADPAVNFIGFEFEDEKNKVDFKINRPEIEVLAKEDEITEKTETERAEITIIRAILERSRRKWEFNWNGVKISSAITDAGFYKKFESHVYQIAPGDKLDVDLQIKRRLDRQSGVWEAVYYEITSVWGVNQDEPSQVEPFLN